MRKGMPTPRGRVEVIVGPMFAGKTEELLRRVRRAVIATARRSTRLAADTTSAGECAAAVSPRR
jgi:thymidine kinase